MKIDNSVSSSYKAIVLEVSSGQKLDFSEPRPINLSVDPWSLANSMQGVPLLLWQVMHIAGFKLRSFMPRPTCLIWEFSH